MRVDLASTQVRLIIGVSVVWTVVGALAALNEGSHGRSQNFLIAVTVYSAPVWIFWGACWIFQLTLPFRRREGSEWVQVTEEQARSYKYYGVKG